MRVVANIHILGKVAKPWKDREGINRISYTANLCQNGGEIIDTINLSQEQFDSIVAGKDYIVTADYGKSANGNYLRIAEISESK